MHTLGGILADKARIVRARLKAQRCYMQRGHKPDQEPAITAQAIVYGGTSHNLREIVSWYREQGLSARKAREFALSDWRRLENNRLVRAESALVAWNEQVGGYDVVVVPSYSLQNMLETPRKRAYNADKAERKALKQRLTVPSAQGVTSGAMPETAQTVRKSKRVHTWRGQVSENPEIIISRKSKKVFDIPLGEA